MDSAKRIILLVQPPFRLFCYLSHGRPCHERFGGAHGPERHWCLFEVGEGMPAIEDAQDDVLLCVAATAGFGAPQEQGWHYAGHA